MEILKSYTCCFIGHRKINQTDELKSKLCSEIEKLIINKHVNTFLFGSKSQFDDLCHKTVTQLQEKYPFIKRIYVRAEFPYIDNKYLKYLLERYEYTYYPKNIIHAGKAVYVERNYEIINNSAYCICYYDENYVPSKRKLGKTASSRYQPKSGTSIAYNYAVKKKLFIINVIS